MCEFAVCVCVGGGGSRREAGDDGDGGRRGGGPAIRMPAVMVPGLAGGGWAFVLTII